MTYMLQRLDELRATHPELRLYALVDGAQYQLHRHTWLTAVPGKRALFEFTQDAALAHAGPWLMDIGLLGTAVADDLEQLESTAPAVTWLIAPQDLNGLAQILSLLIDARLPDGRIAMVRFWDPRVLAALAQVMDTNQREEYFSHIHEWHLLHNGRRTWIGRHHAHV